MLSKGCKPEIAVATADKESDGPIPHWPSIQIDGPVWNQGEKPVVYDVGWLDDLRETGDEIYPLSTNKRVQQQQQHTIELEIDTEKQKVWVIRKLYYLQTHFPKPTALEKRAKARVTRNLDNVSEIISVDNNFHETSLTVATRPILDKYLRVLNLSIDYLFTDWKGGVEMRRWYPESAAPYPVQQTEPDSVKEKVFRDWLEEASTGDKRFRVYSVGRHRVPMHLRHLDKIDVPLSLDNKITEFLDGLGIEKVEGWRARKLTGLNPMVTDFVRKQSEVDEMGKLAVRYVSDKNKKPTRSLIVSGDSLLSSPAVADILRDKLSMKLAPIHCHLKLDLLRRNLRVTPGGEAVFFRSPSVEQRALDSVSKLAPVDPQRGLTEKQLVVAKALESLYGRCFLPRSEMIANATRKFGKKYSLTDIETGVAAVNRGEQWRLYSIRGVRRSGSWNLHEPWLISQIDATFLDQNTEESLCVLSLKVLVQGDMYPQFAGPKNRIQNSSKAPVGKDLLSDAHHFEDEHTAKEEMKRRLEERKRRWRGEGCAQDSGSPTPQQMESFLANRIENNHLTPVSLFDPGGENASILSGLSIVWASGGKTRIVSSCSPRALASMENGHQWIKTLIYAYGCDPRLQNLTVHSLVALAGHSYRWRKGNAMGTNRVFGALEFNGPAALATSWDRIKSLEHERSSYTTEIALELFSKVKTDGALDQAMRALEMIVMEESDGNNFRYIKGEDVMYRTKDKEWLKGRTTAHVPTFESIVPIRPVDAKSKMLEYRKERVRPTVKLEEYMTVPSVEIYSTDEAWIPLMLEKIRKGFQHESERISSAPGTYSWRVCCTCGVERAVTKEAAEAHKIYTHCPSLSGEALCYDFSDSSGNGDKWVPARKLKHPERMKDALKAEGFNLKEEKMEMEEAKKEESEREKMIQEAEDDESDVLLTEVEMSEDDENDEDGGEDESNMFVYSLDWKDHDHEYPQIGGEGSSEENVASTANEEIGVVDDNANEENIRDDVFCTLKFETADGERELELDAYDFVGALQIMSGDDIMMVSPGQYADFEPNSESVSLDEFLDEEKGESGGVCEVERTNPKDRAKLYRRIDQSRNERVMIDVDFFSKVSKKKIAERRNVEAKVFVTLHPSQSTKWDDVGFVVTRENGRVIRVIEMAEDEEITEVDMLELPDDDEVMVLDVEKIGEQIVIPEGFVMRTPELENLNDMWNEVVETAEDFIRIKAQGPGVDEREFNLFAALIASNEQYQLEDVVISTRRLKSKPVKGRTAVVIGNRRVKGRNTPVYVKDSDNDSDLQGVELFIRLDFWGMVLVEEPEPPFCDMAKIHAYWRKSLRKSGKVPDMHPMVVEKDLLQCARAAMVKELLGTLASAPGAEEEPCLTIESSQQVADRQKSGNKQKILTSRGILDLKTKETKLKKSCVQVLTTILKMRWAPGGHMQRDESTDRWDAPTLSAIEQRLNYLAGIGMRKPRGSCLDVPRAFNLNARYAQNDRPIMRMPDYSRYRELNEVWLAALKEVSQTLELQEELQPSTTLRIEVSQYGLLDAALVWFCTVADRLKRPMTELECGFFRLPASPCILSLRLPACNKHRDALIDKWVRLEERAAEKQHRRGEERLISSQGSHVDDFLGMNEGEFLPLIKKLFTTAFGELEVHRLTEKPQTFCGRSVSQHEKPYPHIATSNETKIGELRYWQTLPNNKQEKETDDRKLNDREITELKSIKGELGFICQWEPSIAFILRMNQLGSDYVKTVVQGQRINEVVRAAKSHQVRYITWLDLDESKLTYLLLTDASRQNRGHSNSVSSEVERNFSVLVWLVFLTDETLLNNSVQEKTPIRGCLLGWGIDYDPYPFNSSFHMEVVAGDSGISNQEMVSLKMAELIPSAKSIPSIDLTDSESMVRRILARTTKLEGDHRAMKSLLRIRSAHQYTSWVPEQRTFARPRTLVHISDKQNVADCLSKRYAGKNIKSQSLREAASGYLKWFGVGDKKRCWNSLSSLKLGVERKRGDLNLVGIGSS